MSAGAQFDWGKVGGKPVVQPKSAFDWSQFGAIEAAADPHAELKKKHGLPAEIDLSKPYLSQARGVKADPIAFSKAYAEVNPQTVPKGFLENVWGEAKNIVGGMLDTSQGSAAGATPPGTALKEYVRGIKEQGPVAAVPIVGPMVGARYEQAKTDLPGAIGAGLVDLVALDLARRGGKAAIAEPKPKLGFVRGIAEKMRSPEIAASTVKEAMGMHPLAVSGVEDLFRAAAPTGKKFSFRSTAYSAAGDLNEIGATLDLKKFRGGTANPDMRARATVNAMNEYLSKMYKEERAPQIQRLAKNPVKIQLGADAAEGMSFLEKNAAKAADRALVQEAQKASTLPVEKLDVLERLVSDELAPYRKMTLQERAAAGVTNPKYAGLKALHDELRGALNGELTRNGEVGLAQYERRYSAVSEFRNQLRDRVNALELERTIPGERIARSLVGGKSGVASASQAAVADANIGRLLEAGFDRLRTSGVKPDRGTATPRSAGSALALRTQPTRVTPMGSRTAPIEPPSSQIPRTEMGTRAERLNLLLPAKGGTTPPKVVIKGELPPAPKITPQRGYSSHQIEKLSKLVNARKTFGRDPKTGKFKVIYTAEPK